jgi:hypothetical protein
VTVGEDDVQPACFPDVLGEVWLRGQVNLSPVPAFGGALLGIFPFTDASMKCGCTPEENELVLTTTALAYNDNNNPNVADVCIVRLIVARTIFADVNLDGVINGSDISAVLDSPEYVLSPVGESTCPFVPGSLRRDCSRADVNQDGIVNALDITSIQQSAVLGSAVPCGGVYATAFSCGSTRQAPITPAIAISFHGSYLNDDGILAGVAKELPNQFSSRHSSASAELMDTILVEFDALKSEVETLKEHDAQSDERMSQAFAEVHEDLQSRSATESGSSNTKLVLEMALSGCAILICGLVVFFVQKKRN